jgi:hypothetical protein
MTDYEEGSRLLIGGANALLIEASAGALGWAAFHRDLRTLTFSLLLAAVCAAGVWRLCK